MALVPAIVAGKILTDTEERSIEVDILEVGEDSVEVRRADGFIFDIPFSKLSAESKESLLRESKPKKDSLNIEKLNALLQLELWKDSNLWDDPVDEVAKRLGWPRESKTATQSSYRVYFGGESPIAGTRPYTAVLYGQNGKVDYLSIMFANKGDSVRSSQVADIDDALDAINEAIEADETTITSRLETLGDSQNEIGGISRGMKERANRWDEGNTSFWLATVKDEYIALRIMPPELADNWGKPEYQGDESVRKAAAANVTENEFGDVLIQNIPMVNQGPKGYCVPATMERYLRYMGIRADMYTLAMAGSTIIGGGTILSELIEGTSAYVRRSSRDLEIISDEISIRTVSKYIDNGQPLMWTMFSTRGYNALAETITKQRKGETDYKEWRKKLRKILRDTPPLYQDRSTAHICLIIGYNDKTDEIAVSDSWGPRFERRWISIDEANAVSQGNFYLIDF